MSFRVTIKASNRYDKEYLLPDKAKETLIDYLAEHCLESSTHTPRPNVIIKIDTTEIPLLHVEKFNVLNTQGQITLVSAPPAFRPPILRLQSTLCSSPNSRNGY